MATTIREVANEAQARGEAPRVERMLGVEVDGTPLYVRTTWPWPPAEGADPFGEEEQDARRFRGAVAHVRAVAELRAELEAAGKLTRAGLVEALAPTAEKVLADLQERATWSKHTRDKAEKALAELGLPGSDSPFAAEVRAALRGMKPAERSKAFAALDPAEQACILAAPAVCSGLDPQMHGRLRESILAELPEAAPLRLRIDKAAAILDAAERAADAVEVIAGMKAQQSSGARPS